jgi:hypothetical protein
LGVASESGSLLIGVEGRTGLEESSALLLAIGLDSENELLCMFLVDPCLSSSFVWYAKGRFLARGLAAGSGCVFADSMMGVQ